MLLRVTVVPFQLKMAETWLGEGGDLANTAAIEPKCEAKVDSNSNLCSIGERGTPRATVHGVF